MRTNWMMLVFALTGCLRLSDAPKDLDPETPGVQSESECDYDWSCTGDAEKCVDHLCVPLECGDAQLSCGLYGCENGACFTACTGDQECAEGKECREGACYDPDATCYDDDSCGGLKCVGYRCEDPSYCESYSDCRGADEACRDNTCVAAECTYVSECGGYLCLSRLCTTTCETSADCADKHYCDEYGACQPSECYRYTDCDDGFTCNDGRCVAGCHENSQGECGGYECNYDRVCRTDCYSDYNCDDGYACKLEQCVPRS